MVFTLGLRHTFVCLANIAGIGTILRSSGIARFVQGGVVKTFRWADNLRDRHVQQNRNTLELEAERIAASAQTPRIGLREHALAFMLHCNQMPGDISCPKCGGAITVTPFPNGCDGVTIECPCGTCSGSMKGL